MNIKSDDYGIDSKTILIKGGKTTIIGPMSNQNGAINYKRSFDIDGGEVLYYGAVGMWKDASPSSSLNTVSFIVFAKQGDTVSIKNENEEELMHIDIIRGMQRISYASNKIELGKTYKLFVNDEEKSSVTVTNVVTIDQFAGNY